MHVKFLFMALARTCILVPRKRERHQATANKTGRPFPTTGLLLYYWDGYRLFPTALYIGREDLQVGSSPSQFSGAHGVSGDPPLGRPLVPAPAAAGSAGVPSRAALRGGPEPDHSPPRQLRPDRGNQSIPSPPILFLWGLDWLGNAMSGDLDLTP